MDLQAEMNEIKWFELARDDYFYLRSSVIHQEMSPPFLWLPYILAWYAMAKSVQFQSEFSNGKNTHIP
jgi:hypothetical protein